VLFKQVEDGFAVVLGGLLSVRIAHATVPSGVHFGRLGRPGPSCGCGCGRFGHAMSVAQFTGRVGRSCGLVHRHNLRFLTTADPRR
jgi:hypothetical protein